MSLRVVMDRLLQDTFVRPGGGRHGSEGGGLALDVHDGPDDYTITASLPGIRPEDVDIQVMGDTVTIRGEAREESERQQGRNVLLRERRVGRFSRTLTLPMGIDAAYAGARFEHGILTLTLPKAEQSRPRRIQVRAAEAGVRVGRPSIAAGQGGATAGPTAPSGQVQPGGGTGATPNHVGTRGGEQPGTPGDEASVH